MSKKRRRLTAEFKKRVALEALREQDTVKSIAARYEVHPNQVSAWKRQAVEGLGKVFSRGPKRGSERESTIRDLHAKIGELTVERDFVLEGWGAEPVGASRDDRARRRVVPGATVRVARQSRSSQYYTPAGESAENLGLMRRLDELYLAHPFYGSRQMARHLRREGIVAGRHRVRRLMGLEAIYRRPRTSVSNPEHRVYPYLLRDVAIDRPDRVWCADITYIPVAAGFFYLVAVMNWASRHVLSWRLSNTMDSAFCVKALDAALRLGAPDIFNTDQGAQFSSVAFTERVLAAGARCSMDGRGRYLDNIFIERLWRSLKYEAVYLRELADGRDAERLIGSWIAFYNESRPHSSLDGRTPGEVYRGIKAAA